MHTTLLSRLISVIFIFALSAGQSWAIPLLSYDLDIFTPGSQTSRDVRINDNFTVNVLLSNYDSTTLFDTVSFDLNYNNNGSVITGSGGPLSGALVDRSPTATWDGFAGSFTDINEGDLLTTLDFGALAGFQSNFGTFLYSSVTEPFDLTGTDPITVASYNFTATALGSSTFFMAENPAVFSYQGSPLDILFGNGTVNVVADVPEPTTSLLFGIGLIGVWASRAYKRTHHQQQHLA